MLMHREARGKAQALSGGIDIDFFSKQSECLSKNGW